MSFRHPIRFAVIFAVLCLAVVWNIAAAQTETSYANQDFVATPAWIKGHLDDPKVILVDVRDDKHFDGKLIPGAIRLPWTLLRYNDRAGNMGGVFVGLEQAQQILGAHGISHDLEVVLYDDRKSDGGATASYVFWALDLLGHARMRILNGGIDAWIEAGGELAQKPASKEPAVYQAPAKQMVTRRWQDGGFVYERLGDPYYQLLDVRSEAEYQGETPNAGLDGTVLKLGHIPGAYNKDYRLNWSNPETKLLKSQDELLQLYAGLDPGKTVITYCHSGRRGSYSYYVLRVMGFKDVILYSRSWMEWGGKERFFPVETQTNPLNGSLPNLGASGSSQGRASSTSVKPAPSSGPKTSQPGSPSGYISCGG